MTDEDAEDTAEVKQFLDDIDTQAGERDAGRQRTQARIDVPKWEYQTWLVSNLGTHDAGVDLVDGEPAPDSRAGRYYEMLTAAGAAGWDIVSIDHEGSVRMLLLRRPLVEG